MSDEIKEIIMINGNEAFWYNRAKDLRIFYFILHFFNFITFMIETFNAGMVNFIIIRLVGSVLSAICALVCLISFKLNKKYLVPILFWINVYTCFMTNFKLGIRINAEKKIGLMGS